MSRPRIVLSGMGHTLQGLSWEADAILRIGGADSMDIVLRDASICRRHAEVQNTGSQWVVRDLARHASHPTLLNGVALGRGDNRLHVDDVVQVGRLALRVSALEVAGQDSPANSNQLLILPSADRINAAGTLVTLEANAQRSWDQAVQQFIQAVTSLAQAVAVRDQYSDEHTRRVTDYALLLAEELKLPATEKYQIQVGTPLHDIGKIGIDDAILRKPGKLTPGEFDFMKTHTVKGAAILASICSLNPMIPIVRHHHERWDGLGYPDGLSREQIAVTARIVAVADAFDAMTSHRPYRPAMPAEQAFQELFRRAGTHFDPRCIQAFLNLRPRIEARLQQGLAVPRIAV